MFEFNEVYMNNEQGGAAIVDEPDEEMNFTADNTNST